MQTVFTKHEAHLVGTYICNLAIINGWINGIKQNALKIVMPLTSIFCHSSEALTGKVTNHFQH